MAPLRPSEIVLFVTLNQVDYFFCEFDVKDTEIKFTYSQNFLFMYWFICNVCALYVILAMIAYVN